MRRLSSAALLALLIAGPLPVLSAQAPFETTMRSWPLGYESATNTSHPTAHAVADLDGDGDLDIVHAHTQPQFPSGSQVFSIIFNAGDGTYSTPVFTTTPGPTREVIAEDLDGDGDIDLAFSVSVDVSGSSVLVYLNNGDATFAAPRTIAVGQTPRDLFAIDIDADGDTDLLTANWFVSNSISVLHNDGGANFSRTDIPMPARPTFVRAGDLDGDGLPEIVVSLDSSTAIQVVPNNGGGGGGGAGFGTPVGYQPPIPFIQLQGQNIAIGDVDNDGDLDVLYAGGRATGYASPVIVFPNDGAGNLGPWYPVATSLDIHSRRLTIADVTGDGLADILISAAAATQGRWVLLPGIGGGQFGAAQLFGTGEENSTISAADVTGDGQRDIIITNCFSKAVSIHQAVGHEFTLPPLVPVDQFTRYIAAADIDLDGDIDIVTAYSARVNALLNDGTGTLNKVTTSAPLGCMADVLLRDLDGDLYPDLLLVRDRNCSPYNFYTMKNLGGGQFGPVVPWFINSAGGNHLAAMDWDNDGDTDVLITETLGCPGCIHRNYLLDNNGDGTFAPFRELRDGTRAGPKRAVGADVNHDGNADIVGSIGEGIMLFPGNGDGTFQTPAILSPTTYGAEFVEVADMNGDGHLDVVYLGGGESFHGLGATTGVLLGDGTGSFLESDWEWGPYSLTISTHFGITILDADRDGHMDILVGGVAGGSLLLFRGNGDGTIRPQERFGLDGEPHSPTVADFDGDGMQDVAAVVHKHPPVGHAGITILRGLGGLCHANCDQSAVEPVLNVDDFTCFINEYASGQSLPQAQQISHYANCDDSTAEPVLNVDDFTCFIDQFAAGCP